MTIHGYWRMQKTDRSIVWHNARENMYPHLLPGLKARTRGRKLRWARGRPPKKKEHLFRGAKRGFAMAIDVKHQVHPPARDKLKGPVLTVHDGFLSLACTLERCADPGNSGAYGFATYSIPTRNTFGTHAAKACQLIETKQGLPRLPCHRQAHWPVSGCLPHSFTGGRCGMEVLQRHEERLCRMPLFVVRVLGVLSSEEEMEVGTWEANSKVFQSS
ncbi:hypothetical protein BV22DRAFT_1043738 [Leucogyrophana mollusca]|uniref:Uncharacterized protein n=1 Tax=Leucogyrophana mollusca TaxID=85980 RepID=A0ACB8BX17_9AGAM|nr:hypothetical protein BV22DRAFT_1043738 [Leucogyrophana mollusca]